MYRLLIVDDEKDILEWLEEIFTDSHLVGMDLEVYTAASGSKALELLNITRFDVVLSDIRMPGINGLELFKRIKVNWPKCKMIFLTGYRDFDNVYEIIQSQGVRYLLKTETDESIIDSVKEAINEIEEELMNKELLNDAKEQSKEYRLMLQKDYINQLLEADDISIDNIKEGMKEIGLPINGGNPLAMIVGRFDNLRFDTTLVEQYENYAGLQMIVEENLAEEFTVAQHIYDVYYCIWLVQPKVTQELEWGKIFNVLNGNIEYIQMACKQKIDLNISFAMGTSLMRINELGKRYRRLKRQLVTYTSLGEQGIMIEEPELNEADKAENLYDAYGVPNDLLYKVNLLEKYIELRKRDEYYTLLNTLFRGFDDLENKYYSMPLETYYNVAMMLLRFINTNNLNTKIAFHLGIYKLTRIDEHKNWSEAINYLHEVSKTIFNLLGNNEEEQSMEAVRNIMEYIQDNLGEDLSLMKLGEVAHFNPSYLSRLFKQIGGHNLSEYIVKERMKKAKSLLEEDKLKVNEIARKVGYELSHSFTRAFRASQGISPMEYKSLYFKR